MLAPLTDILRGERRRTIPAYVGVSRYLGALALALIGLQIATGILLMIYYRPSMAAAHYSTGVIIDEVHLGWLIRALHRRGSDLLIVLIGLHLIRVYVSRAYTNPRQLIWAAGLLLLLVVVAFDLSGVLLPWDQHAYWSTDVLRQTFAGIPVIGHVLVTLLWGGAEFGEGALLRFYAFHIAVLPWVLLLFLSLHLLMLWRVGLKEPEGGGSAARTAPIPFFPDFLIDVFIAFLLLLGVLLSLAVIFPSTLGEQADPLTTFFRAQPRWYLMPADQLLRHVPGALAALVGVAIFAAMFFLPVIDRHPQAAAGRKALRLVLAVLVIGAWILLGVQGFLS